MSSLTGPMPVSSGAPGTRSWWRTAPKSDSATACTMWPAWVIGAVAPAIGAGE